MRVIGRIVAVLAAVVVGGAALYISLSIWMWWVIVNLPIRFFAPLIVGLPAFLFAVASIWIGIATYGRVVRKVNQRLARGY